MKSEALLEDALPYIQVWTWFVIIVMSVMAYRIWIFGKKHPEIFKPDTTAANKCRLQEKSELSRKYYKQSLLCLFLPFVWIVGLVTICYGFDVNTISFQGWYLIVISIICILWMLLMYKLK